MEFMRQHAISVHSKQQQDVFGNLDPYDERVRGLQELLRRPWFRRIWILQEVANARIVTVVCGWKSIAARTFAPIPQVLQTTPESYVQAVLDIMPGSQRERSWVADRPELHTLLDKFRECDATQPEDKIFALLGISSDARISDVLRPDHSKTPRQIVIDTVSFLLAPSAWGPSSNYFLSWSIDTFFENLPCLHVAIVKAAWEFSRPMAEMLLQNAEDLEHDSYHNELEPAISLALEKGNQKVINTLIRPGKSTFSLRQMKQAWDKRAENALFEKMVEMECSRQYRNDIDGTPIIKWAVQSGHLMLL